MFKTSIKSLIRSPLYSITSITILSFCLAANTVIYTMVDSILLRPLAFPKQEQLVHGIEGLPSLGFPELPFSCADYTYVAEHTSSLKTTAAYRTLSLEIRAQDRVERVGGAKATSSLFTVLLMHPAVGRSFTAEEELTNKHLAVVTNGFAIKHFGSAQAALGKTLLVDRTLYVTIGVMPAEFTFPLRGLKNNANPADVFLPASWTPQELAAVGNNYNYDLIGRLKPGVTVQQASAELVSVLHQYEEFYPSYLRSLRSFHLSGSIKPLREEVTGSIQLTLYAVFTSVIFLFVIGVGDIANLLLSRKISLQREDAIRQALGATKWNILSKAIGETTVLAIVSAIAGSILAVAVLPLLLTMVPADLPRLSEIVFNWHGLVYLGIITLAVPLLCSISLMYFQSPLGIGASLRGSSRSATYSKRERVIMAASVVIQSALAFVLLIVSSFLVQSYINVNRANPGFSTHRNISFEISLPTSVYGSPAKVEAFNRRLLDGVASVPGIQGVGTISDLPTKYTDLESYSTEKGNKKDRNTELTFVTGKTMTLLAMQIVAGRALDANDSERHANVVAVSETFATTNWAKNDAVGRRIKLGPIDSQLPWLTIVGVFQDVRDTTATHLPRTQVYVPFTTSTQEHTDLLVSTPLRSQDAEAAVWRQVRQIDPGLPLPRAEPLGEWLNKTIEGQRFRVSLISGFGFAALVLAMLGVGGLISLNTAQRMQEFGLRRALGASRLTIVESVFKQGLGLCLFGIGIGVVPSLVVTKLLHSMMFGLSNYDPKTFISVVIVFLAVGLLSCCLPATKATTADPIQLLRAQQ